MKEMTDQEYVESIVKPLVDSPNDVVTTRSLDERGVLIQLSVNQADMGKVIGREGKTAKSIRSLLRVFGARSDARINLKIVDPSGGEEVPIPEDSGAKPTFRDEAGSVPEAADSEKTEQATSVI